MRLREVLATYRNCYQPVSSEPSAEAAVLTVSFIIPVYNSAATIDACVRSILAQNRVDLIQEIIIINDGSSDESLVKMQALAQSVTRPAIRIENNPRRQYAAHARNQGIQEATGDLVCFIDSDIILPPNYLLRHVMQHQADGRCITFSLRCNVATPDAVSFPLSQATGDFRAALLEGAATLQSVDFMFCDTHSIAELCLTCAVAYRREDLLTVQGCPDSFKGWGFNDTAMAAKVIGLNRAVVPLYDSTVAHVIHAPRSGKTATKWAEFATNKRRYQKMLELSLEDVCKYHVEALEI